MSELSAGYTTEGLTPSANLALKASLPLLRQALVGVPLLGFDTKTWTRGAQGAAAKSAFVGFNNTYNVISTADGGAGSLRDALATEAQDIAANPTHTDIITFDPAIAGGTINLQSTLTIAAPVTITGVQQATGVSGNITISGGNAVTDFTVANTSTTNAVVIDNLTIANGKGTGAVGMQANRPGAPAGTGGDAAGGIFAQSGSLKLTNDTFTNNAAAGGSGGQTITKGAGGTGGNAAGAVFVEPGASVVSAQGLVASGNTATAGNGGPGVPNGSAGMAYNVSNNSSVVAASAPCYCTGTLIATTLGDLPVEALAIGNLVVTASGAHRPVRWIGHRGYAGRFVNNNPDALPICFKAGALGAGVPVRDLWVSPKHAMFFKPAMSSDGVLVPAEFLVNGVSVTKAERVDSVTYWHVELDSHDVLLAEGAPAESFVDDCSRAMFANARSYAALYPDAGKPDALYCAPRLEDGYLLEAIRQAIDARAGIATPAHDCGALQGYIDARGERTLTGWARNALAPAVPVCLDLLIDGRLVAQGLANRRRRDLAAAGYGPVGFAFTLPIDAAGKRVEVRRSADGARVKVVMERAA